MFPFGLRGFKVRYVLGKGTALPRRSLLVMKHVDGRDNLPHVGKATEKSAALFLEAGDEAWRCKSDLDTLVSYPRLDTTLNHFTSRFGADKPMILGYIKYRGWIEGEIAAQAVGAPSEGGAESAADLWLRGYEGGNLFCVSLYFFDRKGRHWYVGGRV